MSIISNWMLPLLFVVSTRHGPEKKHCFLFTEKKPTNKQTKNKPQSHRLSSLSSSLANYQTMRPFSTHLLTAMINASLCVWEQAALMLLLQRQILH